MMSRHAAEDLLYPMDTSQSLPVAISSDFTSLVTPHTELSLTQNAGVRSNHDLSYPLKVESQDTLNTSLHVSLSDLSPSSGMSAMNVVSSMHSSPPFVQDFSTAENISFGAVSVHDPLSFHSSSSNSSASSNSSPSVHGAASAYSIQATSSLVSAVAEADNRPRSNSSASPPSNIVSSGSELGFSSLASETSSTGRDHGFIFPPPDLEDTASGGIEDSLEGPLDAHLMVVGNILKTIANTANSASAACSMGQSAVAGIRIDELKKTIALVSDLIAATQIADSPPLSQEPSAPYYPVIHSQPAHASPPLLNGVTHNFQEHQPILSQFMNEAAGSDAMDIHGGQDNSDTSRKRCASSMAGDRVIKSMKLEQEESGMVSTSVLPTALPTSQLLPSTDHGVPAMTTFVSSNPSSESSSRPESSAGLTTHPVYGMLQQQSSLSQPHSGVEFSHVMVPSASSSPDFISSSGVPAPITQTTHLAHFPTAPHIRTSWSDGPTSLPPRQHQHSLSGSSLGGGINLHAISIPSNSSASISFTAAGTYSSNSSQMRPNLSGAVTAGTPLGRVSRSGSMTNGKVNPFTFGLSEAASATSSFDFKHPRPRASSMSGPHSPTSSQDGDLDYEHESDGGEQSHSQSPESSWSQGATQNQMSNSFPAIGHGGQSHSLIQRQSSDSTYGSLASSGNEVPQEYRGEVDRIFFEFLNRVCSNLDATDSKGEPVHQTLMAKKMQRLDESPDFRPFKFRIQAFTNAFLEELARQGYPEEKIPMKKIRNYLWNQPYISRFNEDGKKAKSKGNHIWNIDAKKITDCSWIFRPFRRRLAGSPPGVAYVGLRWSWTPKIWDPQASRSNLEVTYSSPSLPSWLLWENDVLSGTPPHDAENCDIIVEARFTQDGQEEALTQSFHLNIAPMSTLDTSFPSSRRSSFVGDAHRPRRIVSDSVVSQVGPSRNPRGQNTNTVASTHDAQVMQVLTTAAQRVAQEAQCQVISPRTSDSDHELQALAKQQHVLTVTAQAFDQEVTGQHPDGSTQQSNMLAAAAQQVVMQAARQVAADRSAAVAIQISVGIPPPPSAATQVTVNEVSVATQSAVAQAVEITGPLSSEVDVLMTASSLLQQQTRPPMNPSGGIDPSQLGVPLESGLSHCAGSLPLAYPMTLTSSSPSVNVPFPPALPSAGLSEFVSRS